MQRPATIILLFLFLSLLSCAPAPQTIDTSSRTAPNTVTAPQMNPQPVTEASPALTPPATIPRPALASPDAVFTGIQGEVNVQQVITGQTVMGAFGADLWRGDVIMTGTEAQAEVKCVDGDTVSVDSNQQVTIVCGGTPQPGYQNIVLRVHRNRIEALPAPRPGATDDVSVPVIFSPRNTLVLEQRPTIRWSAVEAAEEYEVIVSETGGELWRETTRRPGLSYPETQPALALESHYLLKVVAHMGPDQAARSSEAVLVTTPSAETLENATQFKQQLETLDLSADSRRFLLAVYYANHEFYDAAIANLVELAQAITSPSIYQQLGQIYLVVGQFDDAAKNFQAARQLAQVQGNPLLQAEAEVGLGHAAYANKLFDEAVNHYQAAMTLYQTFELTDEAEAMAELITAAEARKLRN